MKKMALASALFFTLLVSISAFADCSSEYENCVARCNSNSYTSSGSGGAGCKSKCMSKRTSCLVKSGTRKAEGFGQKAIEEGKKFKQGWDRGH